MSIKGNLIPKPSPFAFTIIHRSGRPAKTGKAWEHSSCEWTRGGRRGGLIFKYIVLNLKVSFLSVKTSSFHHAKVRSPKKAVERSNG